MQIIPQKAHAPLAGLLMLFTMVLLMPAIGVYVQAGLVPGFASIWWNQVAAIAPFAMPIGMILGVAYNLAIGLLVKPAAQ